MVLVCHIFGAFVDFQISANWEQASLRTSIQPTSVFKPSPVMETYTTEGSFINTNMVTADEESQEFDDLIFALKTGEEVYIALNSSRLYLGQLFSFSAGHKCSAL